MLNASSVEAHSLRAGVNEVPPNAATFCSAISVAQRDGWREVSKEASSRGYGDRTTRSAE